MFNNLHELIATMPDEKSCREYLITERWHGIKFFLIFQIETSPNFFNLFSFVLGKNNIFRTDYFY
jgi:hypothetical protein